MTIVLIYIRTYLLLTCTMDQDSILNERLFAAGLLLLARCQVGFIFGRWRNRNRPTRPFFQMALAICPSYTLLYIHFLQSINNLHCSRQTYQIISSTWIIIYTTCLFGCSDSKPCKVTTFSFLTSLFWLAPGLFTYHNNDVFHQLKLYRTFEDLWFAIAINTGANKILVHLFQVC